MHSVFLYGTLRHVPLLTAVLGHDVDDIRPAKLGGYRVFRVKGADYPGIRPDATEQAEGIVVGGLSDDDLARLDYYEFDPRFDYQRVAVKAEVDGAQVDTHFYLPSGEAVEGGPWSQADWAARHGGYTERAAADLMAEFAQGRRNRTGYDYTQMLVRAASAERARLTPKPTNIRSSRKSDEIDLIAARQPYRNFFALTEQRLRFPRFDGTMSAEIQREGFLGGDAVTILPYDPVRDRVLVIEQFRFSPYMRGDPHPWVLEPVAGRVDPGETPEQTGRREMMEEAGLEVGALHHVANYYPSPSAYSEYIYSFVGICDLPDEAAGIGGLASEDEDIRSHILSFDRSMALISDGEADAGPLIISLLWLANARDRLRKSA